MGCVGYNLQGRGRGRLFRGTCRQQPRRRRRGVKGNDSPNATTPTCAKTPDDDMVLETPRSADDASKPDSITVDLSSTTTILQNIVQGQLDLKLHRSCTSTVFRNFALVELSSTVMESGLDASPAKRGVANTTSSSWGRRTCGSGGVRWVVHRLLYASTGVVADDKGPPWNPCGPTWRDS